MRAAPILATLLVTPAVVALALAFGPDPVALAAAQPLTHRDAGFAGAAACATCHPDHHVSWRASYHATMTQLPSPATVRGAFDGREFRYGADAGRPFRDGDAFRMDLPDGAGGRRTATVGLVVGSHRYQQYFERTDTTGGVTWRRLPLLWHLEDGRWLHIDTVFLGPDTEHWARDGSTWNDNCIFCHNTAPQPRLRTAATATRAADAFDSRAADLGIACESCHGPGAAHAQAMQDPLRRYTNAATGLAGVVDPPRLDQERSVAVCGQCHGARVPDSTAHGMAWLTSGPTFRAGDRLREHAVPIEPTTPVRGGADPELFQLRFWRDGAPRLTAYEHQGITGSKCYQGGALTCLSCHALHDSDPRGQLRRDRLGDKACTPCHERIAADVGAHTHHAPDGAGSRCTSCHMPAIVYGVAGIRISHRIENPDPARDGAAGRPHACTLCHADRSLAWSAAQMQRWWGPRWLAPARRADGAPLDLPDALASLLAGDAAQRAVYAHALGAPELVCADDHLGAVLAGLCVSLGDGYPSIRRFAQQALLARERRRPFGLGAALDGVDEFAGADGRRRAVFAALDALARQAPSRLPAPAAGLLLGRDFRLDLRAVVALTDLQGRNVIAIGE